MRNFAVLHSFLIIYWISLCKTLQSACKTDVNYLYKSLKDFSRTNTDRYLHLENLNSGQQRKKRQKKIYIQDIFIVDVKDKLGH